MIAMKKKIIRYIRRIRLEFKRWFIEQQFGKDDCAKRSEKLYNWMRENHYHEDDNRRIRYVDGVFESQYHAWVEWIPEGRNRKGKHWQILDPSLGTQENKKYTGRHYYRGNIKIARVE